MGCLKKVAAALLMSAAAFVVTAEENLIEVAVKETKIHPGKPFEVFVTYNIPEEVYQTDNHDFFTFTIESPKEAKISEIVYPDGTQKDGEKIYTGKTTLKAEIILPAGTPAGTCVCIVQAGYQFCSYQGDCYFPQKKMIEYAITLF
jgi:thiol:disulfide interchange protein